MRRAGFTLIEILVVIAIIAILSGIAFPVMSGVKRRSKAKATAVLITNLGLALDAYATDFGDYPPSTPKLVGLPSNGINDGIECLVRCLTTKSKHGPYYDFHEEDLGNTDHDSLVVGNPTNSSMTSRELYEVIDSFGRPLVYLHNADYDTGHKVQASEDEIVAVKGVKSAKTGQFHGFRTYQLWSLGVDGRGADGGSEAIGSWSSGE